MKIVMLTMADWAGSGYKLCEALNKYTDHKVRLYAKKLNMFNHPLSEIVKPRNKKRIQIEINKCDIVHLKGDWPPSSIYIGFRIKHKPTVVTTSGGFARKKKHGGQGRFNMSAYNCELKTSFEPDLLYPEYSDIWTPHPIDSIEKENIWKHQNPPLLIHSPTDERAKDTEFIKEVVRQLKKKMKVRFKMFKKVTFQEAVELRKEATLFLDQFKVGWYGNSAIEAMQYGIPVAAWISPLSKKQGNIEDCPVISEPKKVSLWVKTLEEILKDPIYMGILSEQTKQWCDEVHSYQSIAKQWEELYGDVCKK